MKSLNNYLIAVATVLLTSTALPEKGIDWKDVNELQELKQTDPRPVMIELYADWCGWCKKMEKTTFIEPEVADYLSTNYYTVKINGEHSRQIELLGKIQTPKELIKGLKIEGYPTLLILNDQLQLQKIAPGYKTAPQLIRLLKRNAD